MDDYRTRLAAMEDWYDQLLACDERERLLLADYAPHVSFLQALHGRVLDVGGGAGLAARFLRPDVHYVVVDPSETWSQPEWVEFGRAFRGNGPQPQFVNGMAEKLPFSDQSFETVLSFWSLNHVEDPRASVTEMARVLRPGGVARLVMEDMIPSWTDIASDVGERLRARLTRRFHPAMIQHPLLQLIAMKASKRWPLQPDHIALREQELVSWIEGTLRLSGRRWLNGFLTLDFVKA